MILYHERRATTQGDKRVEVQVEEVSTSKGPRYVVFTFLAPALSQPELKQEWLYSERERAVRASLAWFDAQVKELFADVPEGQILPRGAQEAVTVSNRASTECKHIGANMGQPAERTNSLSLCEKHAQALEPDGGCWKCGLEAIQPEKVEYVLQYKSALERIWRDEPDHFIQSSYSTLKTGLTYLTIARSKNAGTFPRQDVKSRLIKRTTSGENVTEEVIDA